MRKTHKEHKDTIDSYFGSFVENNPWFGEIDNLYMIIYKGTVFLVLFTIMTIVEWFMALVCP